MSCLHPPRPHQSSLTTRPAFVTVLLLCNFASNLKIDRRSEQTLFGVRNSYKMCLWFRRKFTRETTPKWDITTAPCWPSAVAVYTFPSCCVWYEPPKRGFWTQLVPQRPIPRPHKNRKHEFHKNKFVSCSGWVLSAHRTRLFDFTSKDASFCRSFLIKIVSRGWGLNHTAQFEVWALSRRIVGSFWLRMDPKTLQRIRITLLMLQVRSERCCRTSRGWCHIRAIMSYSFCDELIGPDFKITKFQVEACMRGPGRKVLQHSSGPAANIDKCSLKLNH